MILFSIFIIKMMNPLDHIFAGLLLVTIFTIVLFNQYMRLFFSRILFGKFSRGYIHHYKKLYGELPYERAIKSRLYDYLLHLTISWEKNKIDELTDREIRFSPLETGCSLTALIKLRGNPNYFDYQIFENGEGVYAGYDKDIEGTKIREVYYFIDDRLFMGEYNFDYYDKELSIGFVNSFFSLIGFKNNFNENFISKITINDKQYAQWYENNGISISVKYFNEDDLVKLKFLLGLI